MGMKESQTRSGVDLVDAIISDQQFFPNLLLFCFFEHYKCLRLAAWSVLADKCSPPVQCPGGSVKPTLTLLQHSDFAGQHFYTSAAQRECECEEWRALHTSERKLFHN